MTITLTPIGIVHSPFLNPEDVGKERNTNPDGFRDVQGKIELFKEYERGLADIDGFSHLFILFHFHRAQESRLIAHPPHGNKERGVFSTRSPRRPNALGLTVVKQLDRKDNILYIADLDMIEGTPVLDIKPYTLREQKANLSLGWLEPYLDVYEK